MRADGLRPSSNYGIRINYPGKLTHLALTNEQIIGSDTNAVNTFFIAYTSVKIIIFSVRLQL
jgi:hypothetical protein